MQTITLDEAAQIDCTADATQRIPYKRSMVKPVEVDPSNPLGKLSGRQREVLTLIFAGKTMKELSGDLGLSPKTTDTYKHAAMDKLCLDTNVDLFRFGVRHGLIDA